MKIGIITAMGSERSQIEKLLEVVPGEAKGPGEAGPDKVSSGMTGESSTSYQVGRLNGNEIVLVQSGIGKVNAALGAADLIRRFHPDCIVSTGVAGGIDTSLSVMDVVVGQEVVYHDVDCGIGNEYGQVQGLPPRFRCDERLFARALSLQADVRIRGGLICSGDQFISERKRLDAIKARFPEGLAVEMESGAIAQTCYLFKVPFLAFRIISDVPSDDDSTAHYTRYENFWQVMAEKSFAATKAFLESLPASLGEK